MRILFWEMRRFLRPILLIISGVLTLFFCVMVNMQTQSVGLDYHGQTYLLAKEYYDRFGETLDKSEREEIMLEYEALGNEIDGLYDKYLGEYDVHSKDDYNLLESATLFDDYNRRGEAVDRWGEENLNELYQKCCDIIMQNNEEINNIEFRLRRMSSCMSCFEMFDNVKQELETTGTVIELNKFGDYAMSHLKEDIEKDEISLTVATISHVELFRDILMDYWSLLIFIICAFITTPFLVGNRINNVQAMQLASGSGRAVLKKQLAAALAVTALVNVAADVIFYRVFFCGEYDTRFLLNCPINAGSVGEMFFLDLTYFQFVLLTFAEMLVISLLLTCAVFAASYFCKNYIIAMAVSAILTAVFCIWAKQLVKYGYLFHAHRIPFPIMALLPTALIIAALVILFRKVRREDYIY